MTKCGYVSIIGRPNVGKSTLLNAILQQKISITANKPQTTRYKILGIKTYQDIDSQVIYVDTPGIVKKQRRLLEHYLYQAAVETVLDVDVIIFMVDGFYWHEEDELILSILLKKATQPIILAINKVDLVKNKDKLLPYIDNLSRKYNFAEIIPLSAKNKINVDRLEQKIVSFLPENPFYFPADQVTDRSEQFLVAEIIREKLIRYLGEEVPHELTVAIEKYVEEDKITRISAIIYVERTGQKAIVIGANGAKLKEVGTRARLDLENILQKKVFLHLWVKVKSGWADDKRSLQSLGYSSK